MVFKHYCGVFFNPSETLNKEVGKVSEGPIRVMKGKGITMCTFTSVIDVTVLTEYFKSFDFNFLIFEIDSNVSGFNFYDKVKEDELFGFIKNEQKPSEFESLSNKLMDDILNDFNTSSVDDEIINSILSGFTPNNNVTNKNKNYHFKPSDYVDYYDEDYNHLTKSEINERINTIIDKGLENLTDKDKKILNKLSSLI